MKLSEQEADLFFELMWALQYFVNCKMSIHPQIKDVNDYSACNAEQKAEVREALYKNIEIIDHFIEENPQNFSEENLAIISSWKKYIGGNFYVERLLKKYAVFIQEEKVYGVLGLRQGFDEIIHRSALPLYANTILLPFKGTIIYDGLLGHHNIYFGGGIKRRLKEIYMRSKQNNRIIDSIEIHHEKAPKAIQSKPLKSWGAELDELAAKANKLRGSLDHPAIYSPAFSLVKASIDFAQIAVSDSADVENLHKALKKVNRALNKSNTVLNREEYY